MPRHFLIGGFLVLAVLFGLVGLSAASAQDKAASRDDLLNAFYDLQSQAKDAYEAKAFAKLFVPRAKGSGTESVPLYQGDKPPRYKGVQVAGANGNQAMLIKVWAVPLRNSKEINKVVHIGKYKWEPKEQMAVYFETAVPVQVGFYQEYPNSTKIDRVLPDTKFKSSYQTIQPGKPYRFPVEIELDDNKDDELMSIVVVAAGADPDLPPKDPNQTGTAMQPAVKHAIFSKKYSEALDKKAEEARKVARFRATSSSEENVPPGMNDPDAEVAAGDPDKVAIIGYGPDHYGLLKLRIQKKK